MLSPVYAAAIELPMLNVAILPRYNVPATRASVASTLVIGAVMRGVLAATQVLEFVRAMVLPMTKLPDLRLVHPVPAGRLLKVKVKPPPNPCNCVSVINWNCCMLPTTAGYRVTLSCPNAFTETRHGSARKGGTSNSVDALFIARCIIIAKSAVVA